MTCSCITVISFHARAFYDGGAFNFLFTVPACCGDVSYGGKTEHAINRNAGSLFYRQPYIHYGPDFLVQKMQLT